MKIVTTTLILFGVLVAGAAIGTTLVLDRRANTAHAQEPTPVASPTPVDQHWRVFYGDIDVLEIKLHELNKENVKVSESNITISEDGKRFVFTVHDSECEDCD